MSEIEIENRYKLTHEQAEKLLSQATEVKQTIMEDVYVPNDRPHMDLRLRRKGDKFVVTRKVPANEDASEMIETTIEINEKEFEMLSVGIETRVSKDRYKFDMNGHEVELDVFKGRHTGLVVLEVEFADKKDKEDWLSKNSSLEFEDITGIEKYAGGKLAEKN